MAWQDAVLEERAWRNGLYLGEETPLAPEARDAFKGLRWFELDPRFRLRALKLARDPVPKEAALETTGDDGVKLMEVGAFSFDLLGTPCSLLVFEPAPGEVEQTYFLIPFRDATSGRETYGGGRYLDLDPNADDVYDLDFNRAYHPYCAFDEAWSCTLPPRENSLPVRVEAGERL